MVVKDDDLAKQIHFLQNAEGDALGPFDAFLFLRGMTTLKPRLDCQQKNAHAIADRLASHPRLSTTRDSRLRPVTSCSATRRVERVQC